MSTKPSRGQMFNINDIVEFTTYEDFLHLNLTDELMSDIQGRVVECRQRLLRHEYKVWISPRIEGSNYYWIEEKHLRLSTRPVKPELAIVPRIGDQVMSTSLDDEAATIVDIDKDGLFIELKLDDGYTFWDTLWMVQFNINTVDIEKISPELTSWDLL